MKACERCGEDRHLRNSSWCLEEDTTLSLPSVLQTIIPVRFQSKHDTDSELLQKIIPMKWTILHSCEDDVKFYAYYERRWEKEDKSHFKGKSVWS